jgi:hypothetical protein
MTNRKTDKRRVCAQSTEESDTHHSVFHSHYTKLHGAIWVEILAIPLSSLRSRNKNVFLSYGPLLLDFTSCVTHLAHRIRVDYLPAVKFWGNES